MRSIMNGIGKIVCLGVLTLLFVGCGGGGSDGGFTRVDPIRISITADKTLLPVNSFGSPPTLGGPFTNTFTVRVERADGRLFSAPQVSVDLQAPQGSGALFFLDGDPANEDEEGNPLAFRRLVFEDTTGVVTGHFQAGATPGTVILVASASDPNTGETVTATLEITVGSGASTGRPAFIGFTIPTTPLYITGLGQVDIKVFDIQVLDDGGQPVPNPTANNLRLTLLPGRPNGGERLTAVNAAGDAFQGEEVSTRTLNGIAQATLHTGTLPGTVRVAATADREDNNVDNGIQQPVTDVVAIAISSGEIVSLSFTGPFPGAVEARANTLALDGLFDSLANGVYSRLITLVAVDEFGNPPPPNQPITLRLVDSPLSGYPAQGRGTFDIGDDDGNPEEGGFIFTTQTSSLAGARPNCLLFFGGIPPEFIDSAATSRREFRPNQEGSRVITGVGGGNQSLSVNTVFNPNPDTGFDVPYIVGCAPHFGNVENNANAVNLQTDDSGIANSIMNYPITQLGRHFCLAAEANGGKVGALLCHWYLGIADGSTLTLIPAEDATFTVIPGETETKTITLQLLDGGNPNATPPVPPAPLPAERVTVEVVINDPDKIAVIEAEIQVARAEASLQSAEEARDEFATDNNIQGDCEDDDTSVDPPVIVGTPDDSRECQVFLELVAQVEAAEAALREAQAALAEAEALDALFEPTVTVTPEPGITDANGIVTFDLTISDLPPNGSVNFFFSTVGPRIRAETVQVTATPATSDGGDGGGAAPTP